MFVCLCCVVCVCAIGGVPFGLCGLLLCNVLLDGRSLCVVGCL